MDYTAKVTCAGTDSFIQIGNAMANSTTWTEVTGSFTVPNCTPTTTVDVYVEGPAAGTDMYVDDVFLSK